MKILLHICCGPCSIYPFHKLQEDHHKVKGFFYNPNIHPKEEFEKRKKAVEDYANFKNLDIIFREYLPEDFFLRTEPSLDKKQRCKICWQIRLEETARFAKENGFDAFSTTLLISPYQDQFSLQIIGEAIAEKTGIKFYFEDFRSGFKESQNKAKESGLYRQKYCGCIYSRVEGQTQNSPITTA